MADGDVEVISRTLDDRGWIVAYLLDDGPVSFYHYNTEAKEARFLFGSRQAGTGLQVHRLKNSVNRPAQRRTSPASSPRFLCGGFFLGYLRQSSCRHRNRPALLLENILPLPDPLVPVC